MHFLWGDKNIVHKFYNVDEQLKTHPDFKKIEKALDNLCNSSTFEKLAGQCVSACDILQNMLLFYDIIIFIVKLFFFPRNHNTKFKIIVMKKLKNQAKVVINLPILNCLN